jgi:hypothetical protein
MTVDEWLVATGLVLCVAGYLITLFFSPLTSSFVDGFRCLRCHLELYWVPAVLGFAYVLFDLAREIQQRLKLANEGVALFPATSFTWQLPDWYAIATSSWIGMLEKVAGTFHVAVTAGPLGALAAIGFLLNWQQSNTIIRRALGRRFPRIGWFLYGMLLVAAIAAIVRVAMFFAIDFFAAKDDARQWLFYAGFVDAMGWAFEHVAGALAQICLLLVALAWVRGLNLVRGDLAQFSLRRFAFVLPWLGLVVTVGVLFTQGPLLATGYHPAALSVVLPILPLVSLGLHIVMLLFPAMQINMTVENKPLRKALEQNFRFLRAHTGHFLLFLALSAAPFYALTIVDQAITGGAGEWTSLSVAWKLISPWIWALPIGWILASWVCFDRACEVDRLDRGVAY